MYATELPSGLYLEYLFVILPRSILSHRYLILKRY